MLKINFIVKTDSLKVLLYFYRIFCHLRQSHITTTVYDLHELQGIIIRRKIIKNNERNSGYMSLRYFMTVILPISNYFPTDAINSNPHVLQEDMFIND